MYLLYVDNEFISTADIKEMVDQSPEDTDIINCFSTATLLRTAERLNPDIIIIDIELVQDRLSELFSDLRLKSEYSYVMALIDPDNYDKLYKAIEAGAVDDYLVKPIHKEEFLARVRIAAYKSKSGSSEPLSHSDSFGGGAVLEFGRRKEKPSAKKTKEEDEIFDRDDTTVSDLEDDFTETTFQGPADTKPLTEEEDLKSDEPLTKEPVEDTFEELDDEAPLEEHEFTAKDLLADDEETEESYDFDDIMTEEPTDDSESTSLAGLDKGDAVDSEDEAGFDLFDDFPESVEAESEESGEVEEQANQDSTSESSSDEVNDLEALFEEKLEEDPKEASWDLSESDTFTETGKHTQSTAAKPSADFLDDVTLKNYEDRETDAFYDAKDTFDDVKPKEDEFAAIFDDEKASTDELFEEEPSFESDLLPESSEESPEDIFSEKPQIKANLREISDLPGETADDFLFGDDDFIDEGYDKERLNDLIEDETFGAKRKMGKYDRGKEVKQRSGFFKFLSVLGNIFFVLLLLLMATLSFFLIQSRIAGGVPEVAGYQMYIVLSGSMSPEFDTGSLAFVRDIDTDELAVGDIITYRSQADSDSLTTHRIVEIQRNDSLQFITRGDANNVNDPNPVLAENVVGRVTGSVPYVGYVLNFVQTRQGLILLIFVPGVLIIVYELGKIMKYLTQGNNGKNKKKKDNSRDTRLAEQ